MGGNGLYHIYSVSCIFTPGKHFVFLVSEALAIRYGGWVQRGNKNTNALYSLGAKSRLAMRT